MALNEMKKMRAVVIDRFGGPEELSLRNISIPELKPDQILIKVESAGIGIWDNAEREGMLVKMFGTQAKFPWILGSEGSGKIVGVGDNVDEFRIGDLVYGDIWSPREATKAGFYAEYAILNKGHAWPIPSNITPKQAGALLIDGATAFRGLIDALKLKQDENLMIFGASGGLGHLAIQLGKRLGARVFAVASGEDGVELALKLGAENAVDGHNDNIVASAKEFTPNGFDVSLITVAGDITEKSLTTMRNGGRIAYPWVNQRPPPKAPSNVSLTGYNANLDNDLVLRMNKLIEGGMFEVHLGKTFPLAQVTEGFKAVTSHHLGRLALLPNEPYY